VAFVRVVPVLRTPAGVDGFDYAVPKGLDLHRGDVVLVPFRNKLTPGLVTEVMVESAFAQRVSLVTGRYAGIRLHPHIADLLSWTASRTFSSQPTVLKSWMRQLPKKPKTCDAWVMRSVQGKGSMRAQWTPDPQRSLLERARTLLHRGARVLLLTPWRVRAERLHASLAAEGSSRLQGALLHSELNDGDAFSAWTSFAGGSTPLLIATRLGAWLVGHADVVLIDEPENDDHKQDELAPRYDARLISAWAAAHASTDVESFGRTPPLHVRIAAPAIDVPLRVHVRHPSGRSVMPMLQADTLESLRQHQGPRTIIHPIRGSASKFSCRDCGWTSTCPRCQFSVSAETRQARCRRCGWKGDPPLSCASCGGMDLGKALPGIDRLRTAFSKYEPDWTIDWRDLSNETLDRAYDPGSLVVMTDGSLLGGAGEDVRRRERTAIAFRRLADDVRRANGTLIVQCDEASSGDWVPWLSSDGFVAFQEQERDQRRLFGYPPMRRMVKLLTATADVLADIPHVLEKRGPYPVPYRTTKQEPRFVWQLLFEPNVTEAELIRIVQPFAKRAIIDLDPIAFFR
jgi:primosomal protein N'